MKGTDPMAAIRINQTQWNSVAEPEQRKIMKGLRKVGAIGAKDTIVGDASVARITLSKVKASKSIITPMDGVGQTVCKIACAAAAAAGAAWCTVNTAGIGLAACLAVAGAAKEACDKACEKL